MSDSNTEEFNSDFTLLKQKRNKQTNKNTTIITLLIALLTMFIHLNLEVFL